MQTPPLTTPLAPLLPQTPKKKFRWPLSWFATLPLIWLVGMVAGLLNRQPHLVHVLKIMRQPQAVLTQQFGKPGLLLTDGPEKGNWYAYPPPEGLSALAVAFSPEGGAKSVRVTFQSPASNSLLALQRVGLGENGDQREPNIREATGWSYVNQEFSEVRLSKVRTLGEDGKYTAVSVEQ